MIQTGRHALTNSRLSNIIIRRKNNGTHEEPAENELIIVKITNEKIRRIYHGSDENRNL